MQATQFTISGAEQLIKDFSLFVADDATTKFFAAKSAVKHLEKLMEIVDNPSYQSQLEYIKETYHV